MTVKVEWDLEGSKKLYEELHEMPEFKEMSEEIMREIAERASARCEFVRLPNSQPHIDKYRDVRIEWSEYYKDDSRSINVEASMTFDELLLLIDKLKS